MMDVSSVTDIAFHLRGGYSDKFITLILRGSKMSTVSGLFSEFGAALQFPYYFGENWNAFDECIKDLSWLYASGYVLIVHDADQILIDAADYEGQMQSLLKILKSAAMAWSNPIEESAAWDRPGKPFHIIFQASAESMDALRTCIKNSEVEITEL